MKAILCLLALALPLAAQRWDNLHELKAGDHLRIIHMTGEERKGEFVSFTADSITLRTGKGDVSLDRSKVQLVQVRSGTRRARNAIIGVAVGVAVAITVDQTLGTYMRNEGNDIPRGVTYAVPIGLFGGIGAALPAYRTVYRVR